MSPARWVLALLLAVPPVWAGTNEAPKAFASVRAEAGVSPLTALGSVLTAAGVPALPAILDHGALHAGPAALQTARASTLIMKAVEHHAAHAVPVIPAARSAAATPVIEAPKALLAVNATLKDFSAENLERMAAEDLHGLSAVIMDQLGAESEAPFYLDGVMSLARKRTETMLALRGKPIEEELHNPGHNDNHPDDITARGLPDSVRLILPEPEAYQPPWGSRSRRKEAISKDTVFRYYTDEEGLAAILKGKSLWNGFVSYVDLAPGLYHKSFADVDGVFLTLPSFRGDQVGVPATGGMARTRFVDLRLFPGTPLFDLEPGILMVPLPSRTRGWVLDYYMKWARGEEIVDHNRRMIERIDADGGPGPDLRLPIEIVADGKAR